MKNALLFIAAAFAATKERYDVRVCEALEHRHFVANLSELGRVLALRPFVPLDAQLVRVRRRQWQAEGAETAADGKDTTPATDGDKKEGEEKKSPCRKKIINL